MRVSRQGFALLNDYKSMWKGRLKLRLPLPNSEKLSSAPQRENPFLKFNTVQCSNEGRGLSSPLLHTLGGQHAKSAQRLKLGLRKEKWTQQCMHYTVRSLP